MLPLLSSNAEENVEVGVLTLKTQSRHSWTCSYAVHVNLLWKNGRDEFQL